MERERREALNPELPLFALLLPHLLRGHERAGLGRHLHPRPRQQLLDGQDLQARERLVPKFRVVQTGGGGLGVHVTAGRLERDQHADRRPLALDRRRAGRARGAVDVPRLDLHQHLLQLAAWRRR